MAIGHGWNKGQNIWEQMVKRCSSIMCTSVTSHNPVHRISNRHISVCLALHCSKCNFKYSDFLKSTQDSSEAGVPCNTVKQNAESVKRLTGMLSWQLPMVWSKHQERGVRKATTGKCKSKCMRDSRENTFRQGNKFLGKLLVCPYKTFNPDNTYVWSSLAYLYYECFMPGINGDIDHWLLELSI